MDAHASPPHKFVRSNKQTNKCMMNASLTPASPQVVEVILVELPSAPVGQKSGVRALTHSVAPHATFTQLYLRHHKGSSLN